MDKPEVNLIGKDGNAFAIIGEVTKVMMEHGYDKKDVNEYLNEAMGGDYDHLIKTTMEYCDIC